MCLMAWYSTIRDPNQIMLQKDKNMMTEKIVVVIPVFNRLSTTLECIKKLKTQSIDCLNIVVVDGGSIDGTPEILRQSFPDIRLYANEGDLWWTDAVALAVKRELPYLVDTDFVFLVNNDTVLEEDTVERLLATSKKYNNAIVAASVKNMTGEGVVSGARVTWGPNSSEPVGHSSIDLESNDILKVDVVFGRATLIPVKVFSSIGNFDTLNFPHYYGDSDFFLRASNHGFTIIIDCKTLVRCHDDEANTGAHFVRGSAISLEKAWELLSSKKSNLNLKIAWRFAWKHAPNRQKIINASSVCVKNTITILSMYSRNFPKLHYCAKMLFKLIYKATKMRILYLSFNELRHHGFDPIQMINNKEITQSGIPHTYNLNVPKSRLFRELNRFALLMLRHYNPIVKIRIYNFVRAWHKTQKGKAILIQRLPDKIS